MRYEMPISHFLTKTANERSENLKPKLKQNLGENKVASQQLQGNIRQF